MTDDRERFSEAASVHPNLRVATLDGSSEVLRVGDRLTYFPRAIHVGTDRGAVEDPIHGYYQHHDVVGEYDVARCLVDAMIVEVNGRSNQPSDLGAVLGVARAMAAPAPVSMRALAGQLFVHDGAQGADREALEIGVHCALPQISKADNRAAYHAVFGTTGILITGFTGDVEPGLGGGVAVDANTAICVATINSGGTPVGFKQFEVFWDKRGTKAWQVDGQGKVVAGGGGNNCRAPAYGFLDTLGDVDEGTGLFWGGHEVVAVSTGGKERLRITGSGLSLPLGGGWGFNGAAPTATQRGWAPTGGTVARGGDVSAMTTGQLGDLVCTLIEDLKAKGVLAG